MSTETGSVDNSPSRPPDCLKCAHFKVTWNPAYPRSCGIFGIKCRNLPSAEVHKATGRHCPAFQRREGLP